MRVLAVWLVGCFGLACAGSSERYEGPTSPLAATMDVEVTQWSARLRYHVINTAVVPIRLTFPTTQRYDITVTTSSGEEVWRWSEGRVFEQAIMRAVLDPGETWEMTGLWDHGGRAGHYVATGTLKQNGGPLMTATRFEVP